MEIHSQVQHVQQELEYAKRQLEISTQQKFGLQSALAHRIGTESREIESLLASACADPRKLAVTLVRQRENSKLKYDAICMKLNDEIHSRTRAELALRDIKIAKTLETTMKQSEQERSKKTFLRLRTSNTELEMENKTLAARIRHLESEVLKLQTTVHVYKAQNWEAAFARRKHRNRRRKRESRRKHDDDDGGNGSNNGSKGGNGDEGDGDEGETNEDENDDERPPWAWSRAFQDQQKAVTQSMYDDIESLKIQMRLQEPIVKSSSLPSIGNRKKGRRRGHDANKYAAVQTSPIKLIKSSKELKREREERRRKERKKENDMHETLQREKDRRNGKRLEKKRGKKIHRTGYYIGERPKRFKPQRLDLRKPPPRPVPM